ncbi:DUF1615 domain-containing protein [Aquabacterium sp. A7-Y]|uniref:DUF1615 domain-containing protein n=1 Tax=Aquabacterium sp. A7-Y TaxID=1349605 RepID=UPI00223E4332|nr:DUF1615 domain-containing protein [Aquabacterium sp. A7-Y]MCW7536870.1 DUF1615 domain-containing protein [Aquabacterium sp. A7-Y]
MLAPPPALPDGDSPHPCTLAALTFSLLLAACGTAGRGPQPEPVRPADARALIVSLLPPGIPDRAGWATDLHAALTTLELVPSSDNICAVLAVTEQESTFQVDPPVPRLAEITWQEIDRRAERIGVPALVVRTALRLASPDGRSYAARIDAARTEKELSRIFEDFIGMVPLGRRLFGDYNPVRTGGPMQVSIAYAEHHAAARPYPYPVDDGLRNEVFTRRGGLYFGTAHLLDYPVDYDRMLYRFADFNAGHYASRNAAFQHALSIATGIPLVLDGDLVRHGDEGSDRRPGSTESAALSLGPRLDLGAAAIRRALEQGQGPGFERTALYREVFALAERAEGRALPRAVLPRIALQSPKITRKLTTEWFASRVEARYRRCLARARTQSAGPSPG